MDGSMIPKRTRIEVYGPRHSESIAFLSIFQAKIHFLESGSLFNLDKDDRNQKFEIIFDDKTALKRHKTTLLVNGSSSENDLEMCEQLNDLTGITEVTFLEQNNRAPLAVRAFWHREL